MTRDPPTVARWATTSAPEAILAGVLLIAMFASTFPHVAIGVLGPILVEELWLGRHRSGLAMGINNRLTNRLVALHASRGRRGLVVGVKQSGVKVSHLAAGAALPLLAATVGWRQGLLAVSGVVCLGIVVGRWAYLGAAASWGRAPRMSSEGAGALASVVRGDDGDRGVADHHATAAVRR